MAEFPLCDCGQMQTIRHIVNKCLIMKYMGGSKEIHTANADAMWMENLGVRL